MAYPFENRQIDANIRTLDLFSPPKMEDKYLAVRFRYKGVAWNGAVPIKAKYQGTDVPLTLEDVEAWVKECYAALDPANYQSWRSEQEEYWKASGSEDTQLVFDELNGTSATTQWLCRKCGPVPGVNPQPGARIKSLRQKGYFIASRVLYCSACGSKQHHDLLIRLPRHAANNQKRSTISRALRENILRVLPNVDCLTEERLEKGACVIDHKFPSSRWVNGETINDVSMTDEQIRAKFQILSNQSNLHKERYCQRCVLEGIRGSFFGIAWYYEGDAKWRGTSKADEAGCVGCPWYDLRTWKEEFNRRLDGLGE